MRKDDPVAVALVEAIQTGDLESLTRLVRDQPGLASARIESGRGGWRTPLHVAADWPGHFPNGPAVIAALIAAGADPNAPVEGSSHAEIALHWAASSVSEAFYQACAGGQRRMAEYLLARGADLNAIPSWGKATPLDAADGLDTGRQALVTWLRAQGAESARERT